MNSLLAHKILMVVLWLLPFSLPLAVWIAKGGASIYVVSAWKELLMAAILLCLLKPMAGLLKHPDKLVRLLNSLIGAYILLGFLYIFSAESLFEFTGGFLFDMRFLFFFLIAQALAVIGKLKPERIARIAVVSGVILAVVAIVQVFILPANFLEHLGYEPFGAEIPGIPPAVTPLGEVSDFVRPQATLRGPNPLAAFLVLPLALLLWQVFKRRERDWKVLSQIFVMAFALALTFSRSAWIAVFISTSILLVAAFRTHIKAVKKLPIAVAIVLVCICAFALIQTKTGRLIVFREDRTTSVNASDDIRSSLNKEALRDIGSNPLGHGPGDAGPVSVIEDGNQGRIAENYYLQVAQELGWLGLALFLSITALLMRKLWQIRGRSFALVAFATLVGLSIANLTLHTWADEAVAIMWWSFAGAVVGTALLEGTSIANARKKKL